VHKAGTEMMIKMEKNMDLKNKYDSIIFDLDGTLWNSSKPICEAWNIILNRHKEIVREPITIEELGQCMGLPMYDIAAKLFPDEKEEVRNALMDELCEFENGYLEKMGGVLFPGLEATLKELKTKYPLYIVSNCQDGYIEAFIKAHKLEKYFSDTECWGRTRAPKAVSNRTLIERNNLSNPVYVGDTAGDASAAREAEIDFIYAEYGFGEVEPSLYVGVIDSFKELKDILL
jgi:phosphoglycolate phosphatase